MAEEINADAVREEMRSAVERVRKKFGEAAHDSAKRKDLPDAENADGSESPPGAGSSEL